MQSDLSYWNNQQRCQAVYVAGTLRASDTSGVVAGFATLWGTNNPRNRTGPVEGLQTEFRAQLAGLRAALEVAVVDRMTAMVVVTDSEKMGDMLEKFEFAPPEERLKFEHVDILTPIQELLDKGKEYLYWLAETELDEQKMLMQEALTHARDKIGEYMFMHRESRMTQLSLSTLSIDSTDGPSTRQLPKPTISKSLTSPPIATVVINGINKMGTAYVVFWGDGDRRNKQGSVKAPLYQFKAEFLALNVALSTAVDINITRVRILTRCQNVKDIFDKFKSRSSRVQKTFPYSEIVEDCVYLASLLTEVHLDYVRDDAREVKEVAVKTTEVVKKPDMPGKWGLKKESPVPKASEDMKPKVTKNQEPRAVYIGGICRGRGHTSAKAVYSVFWESCSPLNQQGPVYGIVNNIRTKLLGVKEALKTALGNRILNVIVRVNDQMVYDTLNNMTSPIGNNDLLNDIGELYKQMKSVKYELTPNRNEFQSADYLAEDALDLQITLSNSFA